MVTGFELSNLVFEIDSIESSSYGVYLEYADDFNIHHNNFTYISGATNGYGMRLSYSDNGLVYGNRFISSGLTGSPYGVYFFNSDSNTFAYNFFSKVYRPLCIFYGGSNNFSDNEIIDTLYDGLYIHDSYNAFRRNRICNSANYDVFAGDTTDCTDSTFQDNTCSIAKSNCAEACVLAC